MQIPFVNEMLALLLVIAAAVWSILHHARATRGALPAFRPLRGVADLEQRAADMVETGRPFHVATGSNEPGALGPSAETLASLQIAQRVAELSARHGGTTAVASGDVIAHAAVRGIVHRTYSESGGVRQYRAHEPVLVAHQAPAAYATGVAQQIATEPPDANIIAGNYGSEALLISAEGFTRQIPQLAGSTSLAALPALTLSADATLVGEELFAAEAYLAGTTHPRARLLTQDALRWLVIGLVIVGIAYQLANSLFALGLPSL